MKVNESSIVQAMKPVERMQSNCSKMTNNLARSRMAAVAIVVLAGFWLLPPQSQAQSADFQIPGGWFYTQTGGDTPDPLDGYPVVDDQQALFWTAFVDLGGVQSVGYPVTQRFIWDGFVTQVFQKAAFQWRPDTGRVEFINVFDDLNRLGFDDALEARLIPGQEQFQEEGLDFNEITARRIALLDAEPALRARYESVSDPLRWFGLPQSQVREYSNGLLRSIRLQRAVLQFWTEDVPWASAGTVTVANGGEEAKALGMWPADAAMPAKPPGDSDGGDPIAEESADPTQLAATLLSQAAAAHAQVSGFDFAESRLERAPGRSFTRSVGRFNKDSGLSKSGIHHRLSGKHADACIHNLEFSGLESNLEDLVASGFECSPEGIGRFTLTGNSIYRFDEADDVWKDAIGWSYGEGIYRNPNELLETALETDPTRSWTDVMVEEQATGEGVLKVITLASGTPRPLAASGRSIRIAIGVTDKLIRSVTITSSFVPTPCAGPVCTEAIRYPSFDTRRVEIKSYILEVADATSSPFGSGPYAKARPRSPSGFGPAVPVATTLPGRRVSGNAAMSVPTRFKWLATHTGGQFGHSEFDVNGGTAAFIGPAELPSWSPGPALSVFEEERSGEWSLTTQIQLPHGFSSYAEHMSVAVADQIIAVGVPHGESRVCSDQQHAQGEVLENCRLLRVGAAYVVTNYDGDWTVDEPGITLNHPAIERYATFGYRVAASDQTVVVIEDQGLTLYGFEANEAGWQEGYSTFRWTPSDRRLRMTDVAISGDGSTIAVGTSLQAYAGAEWPFLQILERPATGWNSMIESVAVTAAPDTWPASSPSVDIDRNQVVVGFPGRLTADGRVGVFAEPVGGWTTDTAPRSILLPGNECVAPGFGRDVTVSPAGVLVGSIGRCAFWFQGVGGDSLEDSPVAIAYGLDLADDLRSFGYAIALSGRRALIGGRAEDGFGSAYLFRMGTGNDLSLAIRSNARPYADKGKEIRYDLTVRNVGSLVARGIEISIDFADLSSNSPIERITAPSNCRAGESLVCRIGAIRAGGQVRIPITARIKPGAIGLVGANAQMRPVSGDFNSGNDWSAHWAFLRD